MSQFIIKKIPLAHCKRGPGVCEKCREMQAGKFCLLDIDPPQPGMLQRRMIEVEINGQPTWREYDVVRVFESEPEALDYGRANSIEAEFSEEYGG